MGVMSGWERCCALSPEGEEDGVLKPRERDLVRDLHTSRPVAPLQECLVTLVALSSGSCGAVTSARPCINLSCGGGAQAFTWLWGRQTDFWADFMRHSGEANLEISAWKASRAVPQDSPDSGRRLEDLFPGETFEAQRELIFTHLRTGFIVGELGTFVATESTSRSWEGMLPMALSRNLLYWGLFVEGTAASVDGASRQGDASDTLCNGGRDAGSAWSILVVSTGLRSVVGGHLDPSFLLALSPTWSLRRGRVGNAGRFCSGVGS